VSLADALKPALFSARAIAGQLGLRPHTVSVVTRAYAGGELGQLPMTETRTPITERNGQPPKVRNLSSEQLALAGYDRATWEIGPITPAFSGGGTLISLLTQSGVGANTEPHIVMTGPEFPNGANFRVVKSQSDHALHYTIQVQRVADGGT
jgi:hypothetical protein